MSVLRATTLLACAAAAFAQCPFVSSTITEPAQPLTYPMTSDRYAVQYQIGGGAFSPAPVYISYYGATMASPYNSFTNYPATESMSFVSIPADVNTTVKLRVTKLWGAGFPASGVTVRPAAKGVQVVSVSGSVVQLSTTTAASFAGDQFVLWWNGDTQNSGSIEGLAFFLNPPYPRPTGRNVKTVAAPADLTDDLSSVDTLDFEGMVAVAGSGAQAFVVPANILNVYLGAGAWVQGKLRFAQGGGGLVRRLYGPGVLDVSRFNYMYRRCDSTTSHADDGYPSISWSSPPPGTNAAPSIPDRFILDGIIITDSDYYAEDLQLNGVTNNIKIIGWNGNNDGLELGLATRVSNVFVRTADDSLKMWGSYITVTNATVWQNWNGGVVNLGWYDNSPGNDSLIDGVDVVTMGWLTPASLSFSGDTENNAVIASLMTPGTHYDAVLPSLYRNIVVEDTPRVLFSLKVGAPRCPDRTCPATLDVSEPSVLNLNLENLSSPAPLVQSAIGFQNVNGTTLAGSMNIGLTNVANAGAIATNGANVTVNPAATPPVLMPAPLSVVPSAGGVSSQTVTFLFAQVVNATPQHGGGVSCTSDGTCSSAIPFTFMFSDTRGAADLGVVNVLINNFLDGRQACYLAYSNPLQTLYLVNDAGTALLPGQSVSAAGTLSNSQCAVSWGSAPVTVSRNNLTVSLTILFGASFSGNRVVYLAARDGSEANNTGWQPMSTWRPGENRPFPF